jgi:hypothetical protein
VRHMPILFFVVESRNGQISCFGRRGKAIAGSGYYDGITCRLRRKSIGLRLDIPMQG